MSQMGRIKSMFTGARITKGAKYILFATVGLSIGFLVMPENVQAEMAKWLIATDESIWTDFYIWQLFTSPILQPELFSLLFTGFMLWMFLPALETWWGTKRFLTFAAYTSVAAILVGTLVGTYLPDVLMRVGATSVVGYPVSGLDPFVFGAIIAYGVLFSERKVQFFGVLPMTGKQLAIGISLVALAFIAFGQDWVRGSAIATAMMISFLITTGRFAPKLWYLKWKQKRLRRHLKVVPDGKKKKKKWVN